MSIERTEFSTGLRVVTDRMPGVHSVSLGVWVGTGSRDESPRISGSSHFLEHLLFKGTPTRSALEIAAAFEAVGGDLNAFTDREMTCFYARFLDKDLGMAVDHMSDMVQNSLLRKPDFESEKQVILEEINMYEDSPDDLIHDLFFENLWPGHPLGRSVLGTKQSINAVSRDQVNRFYRKHYGPANFVISAAGNVDHDQLLKLIRRGMDTGRIKKTASGGALLDARDVPEPSGKTSVGKRSTEQAHILLGTNGVSRSDPDRFAFGLVNDALGGGMSSRLFQEIREKRGLAYSVYSYHSMFTEAGVFAVYAGTAPHHAHQVLELAQRELQDVADNGISDAELDKSKGHMKGSMALSLESTSSRMSRLGRSEVARGEVLTVKEMLKRVEAVTPDQARAAAKRILSQPMSLSVIGPFKASEFKGAL
ncbi:MAG: insulinase family protein [Actinobacteria bacterium]|nr:insulinase family protein [Actinomycetota bacterium]